MPKKKTGISRRRAITIASAAAATTVLPSWVGPVASAEASNLRHAPSTEFGGDHYGWWTNYVRVRLEPVWKAWCEMEPRYERHVETAKRLLSSDDMDEIMEHSVHPDVIAFHTASEKVHRVLRLANVLVKCNVAGCNEAEWAVKVACERRYQEMLASKTFQAMNAMWCHANALAALGRRAKDPRLTQHNMRLALSREFERQSWDIF